MQNVKFLASAVPEIRGESQNFKVGPPLSVAGSGPRVTVFRGPPKVFTQNSILIRSAVSAQWSRLSRLTDRQTDGQTPRTSVTIGCISCIACVRCSLITVMVRCSQLQSVLVFFVCTYVGDSLPAWVEQGDTDADNAARRKRPSVNKRSLQEPQTHASWVAEKATAAGYRSYLRQVFCTYSLYPATASNSIQSFWFSDQATVKPNLLSQNSVLHLVTVQVMILIFPPPMDRRSRHYVIELVQCLSVILSVLLSQCPNSCKLVVSTSSLFQLYETI